MCGHGYIITYLNDGEKKLLISDHDRAMCKKTFCFDGARRFLQGTSSKNKEIRQFFYFHEALFGVLLAWTLQKFRISVTYY